MKISIITATYNAAGTISDCIASVAGQNVDVDVEHMLVDGASSDQTVQIANDHPNYHGPVISEPDRGIYDAMNKGLRLAGGDVIGILNADDYYPSKDVLQKVAVAFSDPKVEACYGDLIYVNNLATDKVVRYWKSGVFSPRKFYWGWMPPHPTFFVRRSVYERFGHFNLELGSAADYEIMLRFLLKNRVTTLYIPEVLVHMRTGGVSNASLRNRLKANRMDRKAWAVNGLRPRPWTIWAKPMRKLGQWINKKGDIQ